MKQKTLYNIFNLINDKTGKPIPVSFKIANNIPLTKEELVIDGSIGIKNNDLIETLPAGLVVNGTLSVRNCKNFRSLGIATRFYDVEIYRCPNFKELPENLDLTSLEVSYCGLEKLPEKLEVHHFIDISNTPLAHRLIGEKGTVDNIKKKTGAKNVYLL